MVANEKPYPGTHKMADEGNLNEIYKIFRRVGDALRRVNGNNTNSGNLSMLDPKDPDRFYVTATGSQIGALILRDIVPVRFSEVSWGDGRATTESNIHRRVLGIPGVRACIHCHHIISTVMSFDSRERLIFLRYLGEDPHGNEEFVFQPVDIHGASIVRGVKTGSYKQPVGSLEMENRIPKYLAEGPVTVVRGHGPFARGASLDECLRYLSVFESSATLALNLARRGVNLEAIQTKIMKEGPGSIYPSYPQNKADGVLAGKPVEDPSSIREFTHWLDYIYEMAIGAFRTGSMSRKVTADEMIFCPNSAVPEGVEFQLLRTSIKMREDDDFETALHKLIYAHTNFTACIMASNPLITAEGMATLAEMFGTDALTGKLRDIPYSQSDHPVVAPIDAEAIYLNPRLGLVDGTQLCNRSSENPILNMLRWHKGCCIVAGFGIIATGDTTLEQAAHNVASAERIGRFRTEVYINEKLLGGPPLKSFDPKTI
jgi:ribulose-5-phosphate 4-epimerase/fuculose-1-phosphate aldolase